MSGGWSGWSAGIWLAFGKPFCWSVAISVERTSIVPIWPEALLSIAAQGQSVSACTRAMGA